MVQQVGWQGPEVVLAWAKEVAWHGPRLGLPCLGCLLKIRKQLEFNFSTAVDGAVKVEPLKMKCQMSKLLSAKLLLLPDHSLPS